MGARLGRPSCHGGREMGVQRRVPARLRGGHRPSRPRRWPPLLAGAENARWRGPASGAGEAQRAHVGEWWCHNCEGALCLPQLGRHQLLGWRGRVWLQQRRVSGSASAESGRAATRNLASPGHVCVRWVDGVVRSASRRFQLPSSTYTDTRTGCREFLSVVVRCAFLAFCSA